MSNYIGVITLSKSIHCRKEISGNIFNTRIAGRDIKIIFPSIPDNFPQNQPDLLNGDLIVPGDLFKGKVNWGKVNSWPQGLFTVKTLLCHFSGNDTDIHEIYEDFPRWKEKLYKLPDETVVLSGHTPATTIEFEKRNNPFVRV